MVLACLLFFSANNARFAACQKPRCSCARKSLRCAPKEVHEYVRHVFEISDGLRTQLAAAISNPLFYEASITDTDGMVLASTDENKLGTFLPRRASLVQLGRRSFLGQIKALLAPRNPQLLEVEYPFITESKPLGEVRVVVHSALLVQEIKKPGTQLTNHHRLAPSSTLPSS